MFLICPCHSQYHPARVRGQPHDPAAGGEVEEGPVKIRTKLTFQNIDGWGMGRLMPWWWRDNAMATLEPDGSETPANPNTRMQARAIKSKQAG